MTRPAGIYKTPTCQCPDCGYLSDSASVTKGKPAKPRPMDFSICLNCGAILVFKPDLTLRQATPLECEDCPAEAHEQSALIKRLWPNGIPRIDS